MESESNVKQIFLYVTLKCNCSCIDCYIHNHYSPVKEMPIEIARDILEGFRLNGAHKLTLLGGEPTIYPSLPDLVKYAKEIGYDYIRIQTNGQFNRSFLKDRNIKNYVDTFSFSIDGPTNDLNQRIRVGGDLKKTISNMSLAKILGFDVRVNITVMSLNLNHVEDIIKLLSAVDPSTIYFNIVFPMGSASFKPYLSISPLQWVSIRNRLIGKAGSSNLRIKIPTGYAKSKLSHKCLALNSDRLYIMPNGDAYPCILFIDNPRLSFEFEEIDKYKNKLSEYLGINRSEDTFCPLLIKYFYNDEYKPVCLYERKIFGRGKL